MSYPYQKEIEAAARKHGLDPVLVAAICSSESDFRPEASRYEPKFKAQYIDYNPRYLILPDDTRNMLATSIGLMQIMGVTAVEFGLKVYDLEDLFDVGVNLEYGCRVLAKKYKKYGPNIEPVIAAYEQSRRGD